MNFTALIKRLIEIEQAIGVLDDSAVRRMVWEAQECTLQIQKEAIESRRPSEELNGQFDLSQER